MTESDSKSKDPQLKLATFKRILPFLKSSKREMFWAILTIFIITGLSAGLPLIFRELIDKAIPSKDINHILRIGSYYLLLLIGLEGVKYIHSIVVGYMGLNVVNTIKEKLLKHILSLSVRFFDKQGSGKLISRVESDAQQLYMLFSSVGLNLLWAILNISISLIIMFSINAKLTLYVFSITPIYILVAMTILNKLRTMYRKERKFYSQISGHLGEHIKAIPLLRSLNSIKWSRNKLHQLNQKRWKYSLVIHAFETVVWFVLLLIPQLLIALIFYKSATWIKLGTITIGTVWMFIQYLESAIRPIFMISEQIGEIQKSFGAADRIFEILDTTSEVKDPENPQKLELKSSIEFKNLSFYYEKEKPIIKNLNFSINRGETVAFVGPTGSGKTTIISLLARFYDPIEGTIQIDGTDLKNFSQDSLRKKIGIVFQDIFLFPGNIRENIRVFNQEIKEENILDAISTTESEKFINRLAKGLDTIVSEDGSNFSFGERQLLSFSRALAFNPEILIMDEATSSVDPTTEAQIQKSMRELTKGRTSIIIAHRLSTVVEADKIFVLEDGIITEEGNHSTLMNLGTTYFNLYQTQMGIENEEQGDMII